MIKSYIKNTLIVFKEILTKPKGWLSWALANLIVNSPWIITGFIFIITNDPLFLTWTTAIIAFQWLPIPIETLFVVFFTLLIYKFIK
jgi:hypothetical protein